MPSHPPSAWDDKESVSRTMLYKKITKPLLERQRRARINRCLDELKELMSAALASEGENLTKLEKADVLELTVRHLHQLHREGELTVAAAATGLFGAPLHAQRPTAFAGVAGVATPSMERHRYQGGFMACAQHVASYVMKTPGLEPGVGQRLLAHLARISQQISPPESALPHAAVPVPVPAAAALPAAVHPESPPSGSFVFPLAHPTLPREYSITAQFQVYRNHPLPDQFTSGSGGFRPEVTGERSDDDSINRQFKSEDSSDFPADTSGDTSGRTSGQPGTSSDCLVVESRIVHFPQGDADGAKDAGLDPMWRPW